jgi:hypothetical protein
MLLPTPRVRDAEPLHERRQIAILPRPQHEVPVIGHEAIGQEAHSPQRQRLAQDPLECVVVLVGVE